MKWRASLLIALQAGRLGSLNKNNWNIIHFPPLRRSQTICEKGRKLSFDCSISHMVPLAFNIEFHYKWKVCDIFFLPPLQYQHQHWWIPSVITICRYCVFLSLHLLSFLSFPFCGRVRCFGWQRETPSTTTAGTPRWTLWTRTHACEFISIFARPYPEPQLLTAG